MTRVNITGKVAVCFRFFSANPILREEFLARYRNVAFNDAGAILINAAREGLASHWGTAS